MNEIKLISSLMPSHPDIQPILQYIREKYSIPEISPEDYGITEILLADEQIDWDAVRQDIEDRVRSNSEFLPAGLFNLLQKYMNLENQPLDFVL